MLCIIARILAYCMFLTVYSVDEGNLGCLVSPSVTVIHESLAGYRPGEIVLISILVVGPSSEEVWP